MAAQLRTGRDPPLFWTAHSFKGTVHSKLKRHPFTTHHYVSEGSSDIFLIHVTLTDFH